MPTIHPSTNTSQVTAALVKVKLLQIFRNAPTTKCGNIDLMSRNEYIMDRVKNDWGRVRSS